MDTDSDTFFVGCDAFTTISGPDCDDSVPSCTSDCSDGNTNGLPDCAEVAATVCTTLGNAAPPAQVDEDVWIFTGSSGEDVMLTLAAQGSGSGNAQLVLVANTGGASFSSIDTSALPNVISVTLPDAGEYRVGVIEQPEGALLPGEIFRGDYCLTVEASQGGSSTLAPLASVE